MIIKDGTGSGRTVKVNAENQMMVKAVTEDMQTHVAQDEENSYIAGLIITPTPEDPSAEANYQPIFYYMKNEGEEDMILTEVMAWAESPEAIDIYFKPTGTPIGGTNVTPFNFNLGSGKEADGTFIAGTDITGLSGGDFMGRLRIPANDSSNSIRVPGVIIIPKNNTIMFKVLNGDIPIEIAVVFYYHPIGE